jgi:septal ring factor EnvC (AmiA/AmiB activator)
MLSLGAQAAPFGKMTERSKQKAAAEAERAGVQQKLSALKKDISKTESAKDDAADTLAESEQAISTPTAAARPAQEQADTNVAAKLSAEHDKLAATVAQQKQQLAAARAVRGRQRRPHQAAAVRRQPQPHQPRFADAGLCLAGAGAPAGALRANLKAVEVNQAEAQNAKDELEEIAQEQLQQKAKLEQEKARRAALLTTLSKKLVAQRKEAGNLERDEQRMTGLVDKLNKLIAEQAAAAAAEKKRQEQLAAAKAAAKAKAEADARALAKAGRRGRAPAPGQGQQHQVRHHQAGHAEPGRCDRCRRTERCRQAGASASPGGRTPPAKAADTGAGRAGRRLRQPERPAARPGGGQGGRQVRLQARRRPELEGRVHPHRRGRRRARGGRRPVVFADWLRGFGNLIIVDHGSQYMSIYGNNQSLLKRAGDIVKAGDPIASAGNSGGNEESGLYFELRHQGAAFDPAGWVKF